MSLGSAIAIGIVFSPAFAHAYLGLGPLVPILASSVLWVFGLFISGFAIFYTIIKKIFKKKSNKTNQEKKQ